MTQYDTESPLPIGGITTDCGICGGSLDDSLEDHFVGLNAILCKRCSTNIHTYSPIVEPLILDGRTLLLCQFSALPQSPYYGSSARPTFLSDSGTRIQRAERMQNLIDHLTTEEQALVWYRAANEIPAEYASVEPDLDWNRVFKRHCGIEDVDSDSTYEIVQSFLPRPYFITGEQIYANFSGETTARETIAQLSSDVEKSDSTLGSYQAGSARKPNKNPHSSKDSDSEHGSEQDSLSESTEQRGITSF